MSQSRAEKAYEKFQKNLTDHQQVLVKERLLQEAMSEAVADIESPTESGARLKIIPHNRIYGTNGLRSAIHWFHDRHRHYWASYPTYEGGTKTIGPGDSSLLREADERAREEAAKNPQTIAREALKKALRRLQNAHSEREAAEVDWEDAKKEMKKLGLVKEDGTLDI